LQPDPDDEQSKRLREFSTQLEISSANRCALWFIPYGFGCAIAVCGLLMSLTQSELGSIALKPLNGYLLLGGITTFFLVSFYYDYRIKAIAKRLFRQKKKEINSAFSLPLVEESRAESLRRWTGLEYDWIHEGEGSNVPPGLGRMVVSYGVFCCYCVAFFMFISNGHEQSLFLFLGKIC
jgi:hypothetical protein